MQLCSAYVERFGNGSMRCLGDVTEGVLHGVQDWQEWPFKMQMLCQDSLNIIRGGCCHGLPLAVAAISQSAQAMNNQYQYTVNQ